ncbi:MULTISPECIES: FAS1-like dehydratase domain-containing protein [Prauserella salsuginis group]|uniref:MaoC family dehydratase N-terminal domain-containing protein n=1 Tax=Prauserella salsuginis TaxID=387889 RepID=A0ABW6G3Y6_9PSEU|nr:MULTISPECIES: MaoC family dehydratase N-terminal domain-containing protein [Prauserella salsuginis group]MCR3718332.1 3-methylfumaryl-CoA hydratase [Prauserella flava]MCR3732902.1 3-methylfumaryl-CoA hydratase [Prauserella salsuginis]
MDPNGTGKPHRATAPDGATDTAALSGVPGLREHLDGWNPPPVRDSGVVAPEPVAALSALFDRPPAATPGDPLPPLWHWLHLLDWPEQHRLGPDGHPLTGPFLPPIPDRRRMFAGGRVHCPAPLVVGTTVERTSSMTACTVKDGRNGQLAFVTVRSDWYQDGELRVTDELDYVYRSGDEGPRVFDVPTDPPPDADTDTRVPWRLTPDTSPVALFRFSALTANAHRIHYDAPYARDVEGYPGLVVHGPLLVLLMLEAVGRADSRPVAEVRFRLRRPVFSGMPVLVRGGPDEAGGAAMAVASAADDRHATADVRFRS